MTEHKIRRFSAGDVLDQRGDLADHLSGDGKATPQSSEMFRDLITGTLAGAVNSTTIDAQLKVQRSREAFSHVPGLIWAHLKLGEVFRVSADMTELIRHAAALLDDTDRWSTSLLPTEAGFVRFDAPLPILDARGNEMLIHVITWGPAELSIPNTSVNEEATFITMWNDLDVQPDHYSREMLRDHGLMLRKIAGRWSFIGGELITEGQRMGPALIDPSTLGSRDEEVSTPFTNNHRLIMAMCMLMDQTIVEKSAERPNVHARRRAKERKMSQSDITVVTLRRAYRKDNGPQSVARETNREWHHRWVVRGHWRWARVGQGRREIRRVWVAGHVKGPEDKPLKITKKVYDLKR